MLSLLVILTLVLSKVNVVPQKADTCMILTLTHYQTTNLRLFQTESVCRRQFQI